MNTVSAAQLGIALWVAGNCASVHAQAAPKPEVVRAQVVKVDAPRGKVTLKHAPIQSIQMEAMTMPFKVREGVMLDKFKPGDQVRFSVTLQGDELLITRIEAAK